MNVSDVAREAGIATSAVRFYERKGVLPGARRRANGYREYTEEDLCRLRLVVSLRTLGLDLSTAGRLADLCRTGHCDTMTHDLAPLVARQRAAVARARVELDDLDRQLAHVEALLATGDPDVEFCMTPKGGESDDELLRPGMPVSAYPRLPMLNRP